MLSGYDVQLPDGKIPLYSSPGAAGRSEPPITAGRSQHIVQGITLWKTYLHTGDKEWACKCYEGAKKANAWWFADRGDGQPRRDARKWGMLGFGYDPEAEMGILGASLQPYVAKAQYAYFETYDDSPQWTSGKYFVSVAGMEDLTEEKLIDESRYVCRYHMADIYTLERCCLYAVDCESLSHMARALGREEEAAYYEKKRMDMAEQINARMWCEEDGCYYNLKFDGTFSKRQSPDCFMPLMTGCVPKERKERLLQLLKDENKFWGRVYDSFYCKRRFRFFPAALLERTDLASADFVDLSCTEESRRRGAGLGTGIQSSRYAVKKNGTEMVTVRKITAELQVNAPEHIIITGGCLWDCLFWKN